MKALLKPSGFLLALAGLALSVLLQACGYAAANNTSAQSTQVAHDATVVSMDKICAPATKELTIEPTQNGEVVDLTGICTIHIKGLTNATISPSTPTHFEYPGPEGHFDLQYAPGKKIDLELSNVAYGSTGLTSNFYPVAEKTADGKGVDIYLHWRALKNSQITVQY